MDTDLKLVKRAQKGDAEAFAEIYSAIYKDMYRFALYTLRSTIDAEDVVSEAVVDAFASIRKLRKAEAFNGWIFRILANKCANKLRESSRRTSELDEEALEVGSTAGFEEGAVVRQAFFELTNEERLILGLHLFGGYKSREIAEILGLNENTVRSKESRGLKKLAKKLT